jgi:hypothetical protein
MFEERRQLSRPKQGIFDPLQLAPKIQEGDQNPILMSLVQALHCTRSS